MERTKIKATNGGTRKNVKTYTQKEMFQVLSALTARMSLASTLGQQQYGGDRDIYEALGYKTDITFADYYNRYERQDIAKAVIDRPVRVTWNGDVNIVETNDSKETSLEKEWKNLNLQLGLKSIFARADKLSGIGKYGALLLGLNDVSQNTDFQNEAKGKELLYVKPLCEESAKIHAYEDDPNNPRYGLPKIYQITIKKSSENSTADILVHHSRIIHIVDDLLESEVEGVPRLKAVFNRLMDLEKLVGGDAEMFWRGARPGYIGKADKDTDVDSDFLDTLQDQFDEFDHYLRRILIAEGIDFNTLAQQIADPSKHVDTQIQMLSAVTGIPKRILTGSERGELASSQDKAEWLEFVQSRREEFAEPRILRPFVDRIIDFGILPTPKDGYSIVWKDLFSISEKEKAEIGKIRASALKEYASQPGAEMTIPQDMFLEYFLGFNEDQIELIRNARDEEMNEPEITPGENEILNQKK